MAYKKQAKREPKLHQCRGRLPLEGELIHDDLVKEPAAAGMWKTIGWRVEAMAELMSPDCPTDIRKTIYFEQAKLETSDLGRIESDICRHKELIKEVLKTGFERTGWPVCRWSFGEVHVMDGRNRLAIQRARGVPARAILLGQKS